MSRSNNTSGHPATDAKQVTVQPRPVISHPPRHLTLVVDREWQIDPVHAFAAIGPSTDF
ncbi:hypothetical protein HYPP_03861 [Hyphomicrobium sp. ghe19]|nr:hypothetical protein HYPP_03861 [Hyphomicrobium sp. ghe19]